MKGLLPSANNFKNYRLMMIILSVGIIVVIALSLSKETYSCGSKKEMYKHGKHAGSKKEMYKHGKHVESKKEGYTSGCGCGA